MQRKLPSIALQAQICLTKEDRMKIQDSSKFRQAKTSFFCKTLYTIVEGTLERILTPTKGVLLTCLFYLQIHKLMRYLHRRKTIILMYHGFTNNDKRINKGIENYQGKHLDFKIFRTQVAYLKKYYNVISLGQLIEHYTSGTRIPNNSVVITIDDGYESNYTLAYPILKEFDVPATISLTTNFIDNKELQWVDRVEYAINMTKSHSLKLEVGNDILSFNLRDDNSKMACHKKIRLKLKSVPQELIPEIIESLEHSLGQKLTVGENTPDIYRPLEWHEVLEMIKSGIISIGSHTCTHVIMTLCRPENMKAQLSLSKQLIEKKTGLNCRLFCYPNGAAGYFDGRTKNLLKELGYSCGLTTIDGMNDKHSDVFELKRIAAGSTKGDLILFIMTLSGIVKFLSDTKQSILNIFVMGKK